LKVTASNAEGCDGLPGNLIKKLAPSIAPNICKIWNASIVNNIFPEMWKLANITPVYKQKGTKSEADNYRPISLLPVLARALEKILAGQLISFCDVHKIIPPNQHGFRKGYSCETALIQLTDSWLKYIDKGEFVGTLLVDLSKAFDTVSHRILLLKLQSINLSTDTLCWFHSYLSNRRQHVVTRKQMTDIMNINRGVPQGNCLSPLLFNIYTQSLISILSYLV